MAKNSQNTPFSTPFMPKDYNRQQFNYEFAKEYIDQSNEITL